ncbi:sphingosine kinase [Natronosporangium hydrolyticum]|uniref:Sphingosine kinase n=1 Tax=Natronosporangium hydrolyticum TaxID=2811111 RepID=A0A895YG73_9ACTN|nr:diacylglycerol kinase family protein [Natronosporangium hydrolyticum]QSB12678.1 sphingosine kinase [Natronosporangium hydrolyticum]
MEIDPRAGRVAVLTNPTAGRRRHRRLVPQLLERIAAAGELDVLRTTSAAEATAACREVVAAGATTLVVVGGDGTLHAAIQAVAGSQTALAVVPAGTGNDFAAALGVPADPMRAADSVAAALRSGGTRQVDLARVTNGDGAVRWYGAVLAAGFDAIVNERANRIRWPRGDRRYDVAIFLELVRLRPRRYRLVLDGEPLEVSAVLVALGNTASYGGGIRICPTADPADGKLDVVIGRTMGRFTLTRLRPLAYRGTHLAHPLVDSYRATTVEISAAGVVSYADGERCLPLPVTVTAVPGALRVLGA